MRVLLAVCVALLCLSAVPHETKAGDADVPPPNAAFGVIPLG